MGNLLFMSMLKCRSKAEGYMTNTPAGTCRITPASHMTSEIVSSWAVWPVQGEQCGEEW